MLFRFVVGTVTARLVEGDRKTVKSFTAVTDPKALRDDSFRNKLWDGLHHFYDSATDTFPAGLYFRVARRLKKRGNDVEATFDPSVPEVPPVPRDYLEGIDFRDHQHESINVGLERGRGIFWQATNAGKTEVMAALLGRIVREKDWRALVIVPNKNLLHQTAKRLQHRIGPDVRVTRLGDGLRGADGMIVVATQGTLLQALPSTTKVDEKTKLRKVTRRHDPRLLQLLQRVRVLAVDEAHHAVAETYHDVMQLCERAVFRFGFTGSADVSAQRHLTADLAEADAIKAKMHTYRLEAYLGPVIHRVTNAEMIEKGFSAKPRVFLVTDRRAFGEYVDRPKGRFVNGKRLPVVNPYGEVFREAAIEDATFLRSVRRVTRALISQGKPPFVFSHSVEQLRALKDDFENCKVPLRCMMLYGDDSTQRRDHVLKRWVTEGDFALLSSSIFDEGADVPEIRSLVFAGARKSVREVLQRVGRGVRRKDDDNTVVVVDFVPCHAPMLAEHAEEREAIYRNEGFPIKYVRDIESVAEVNF